MDDLFWEWDEVAAVSVLGVSVAGAELPVAGTKCPAKRLVSLGLCSWALIGKARLAMNPRTIRAMMR